MEGIHDKWKVLVDKGYQVNPCNSKLHPAVQAGLTVVGEEISVQQAYTPNSQCFGCGKLVVFAVYVIFPLV